MKVVKYILLLLISFSFNIYSQPAGVDVVEIANGFNTGISLTNASDGTNRLFVIQQSGQIKILDGSNHIATPFLDISSIVLSGGEQGLLGLAFHPDYENNGFFYVFYSDLNGDNQLARYEVSSGNPNLADPLSASPMLRVTGIFGFHNGGDMHFGPDDYLYISTGDGGGSYLEPQDPNSLLGKILRIDVNSDDFPKDADRNYAIPASNPFTTETWLMGFRNPWRFSFDRNNGDIFIGDVGEDTWEEFNYWQAGGVGGDNYGWPCFEAGDVSIIGNGCGLISDYELPIAVLEHNISGSNNCSAIGGYRYRGSAFPNMQGWYFYTDWCDGKFWAAEPSVGNSWVSFNLGVLVGQFTVTGMGENESGEIFIATGSTVVQLISSDPNDLIFDNGFE